MKILNCLLMFLTLNVHAVQFIFEETYQTTITKSESSLKEPHVANDRWQVEHFLKFDNGFGGYITSSWDSKTVAEYISEEAYLDGVNIVHGRGDNFYLIHPDTNFATLLSSFWIEKTTKFKDIKKIVSIREEVVTPNWFSQEKKYRYWVELDDGSHWLTPQKESPWITWKAGTHVYFIGNSQRLTLINIDAVQEKPVYVIKEAHVMDLERL